MSPELLKRIQEALTSGQVATRRVLLGNYPMELTLTSDYFGYHNPAVTDAVDSMSAGEVGYVQFIPMPADGLIICKVATATDKGAIPFQRSGSRNTGLVSMRAALHGFHLDFPEDRKLKLPIETKEITLENGTKQTVMIIHVKRPASKKAHPRPRKSKAAAAKPETIKPEAPKPEAIKAEAPTSETAD